MSEIEFIIIMFKLHLESKSVVKTTSLFLHAVLIIANILPFSLPTKSTFAFRFFLRIHQGSHTLVVGALWLDKIDEIELVCYTLSVIAHLEIVPLSIVIRSIVIFQNQVIFVLSNLNSSSKIP